MLPLPDGREHALSLWHRRPMIWPVILTNGWSGCQFPDTGAVNDYRAGRTSRGTVYGANNVLISVRASLVRYFGWGG